jgi:hypothetical protein
VIGYWFKKLADALDEEIAEVNTALANIPDGSAAQAYARASAGRDAALVTKTILIFAKVLRRVARDA